MLKKSDLRFIMIQHAVILESRQQIQPEKLFFSFNQSISMTLFQDSSGIGTPSSLALSLFFFALSPGYLVLLHPCRLSTILSTSASSSPPSQTALGSMAMKTWVMSVSTILDSSISDTVLLWPRVHATASRMIDNAEPFQKPAGSALKDSSSSDGSSVRFPSES